MGLSNLINLLGQLKNDPINYNLTKEDLLTIDKAINELDNLHNSKRKFNWTEEGFKILRIIEFINELFGNSS